MSNHVKKHRRTNIDKGVLARLKSGDDAAFEYVYWSYNSHVFNFIASLLYDRSLAEDLTQNVFLKIWERRESIDPEQGLDAYLFTIARHFVYKETNNRLKQIAQFIPHSETLDSPDIQTEGNIDAASLKEYIDALIEQLPPARKEIFLLSRHQQLSNKEIAQQLSISVKTVENQITRSLRFLREKLSDDGNLAVIVILLVNSC